MNKYLKIFIYALDVFAHAIFAYGIIKIFCLRTNDPLFNIIDLFFTRKG